MGFVFDLCPHTFRAENVANEFPQSELERLTWSSLGPPKKHCCIL